MHRFKLSPAAKVAAFYLTIGGAWILGSDAVASFFFDEEQLRTAQTAKGLFFVLMMTVALYLVAARLQRAEERNRQVESMLRVSQRLETIGTLAATLVHDLNNMLGLIRGFTDLAKMEQLSAGKIPPQRLADIDAAVTRADAMIRQLSLFLQRVPGSAVVIDPGAVVRDLEPLIAQAASRRARVSIEVAPNLPLVALDRGSFEQALINLVVNARDAMENRVVRELRISVGVCELVKHVSIHQPEPKTGRYVRIRVADTGVGIPPSHLVAVFAPFFTTKPPGQGTGLGLPSVSRTMQQNNGWVEVTSEVNRGSQFDLYLPVLLGKTTGSPVVPVEHAAPTA